MTENPHQFPMLSQQRSWAQTKSSGDDDADRPQLSVVAPVFNESETLAELHRRLRDAISEITDDYEIVFVDDGSTDESFEIMRQLHEEDPSVTVLRFSRNFGHHIAMTAGLDRAQGDFVVIMDSDLQDRPEAIPTLYARLNEGYDVVVAERQNKRFGLFKRAASALFQWVMRRVFSREFVGGVFRIMRRRVVLEVRRCREHERLLVGLIDWTGFRTTSVPVEHGERFAGESKYSLGAQVRLAVNSVTAFSTLPLRVSSWLGFFVSISAFLSGCYLIFRRMYWGLGVEGWTSILVAVGFLGGVQLLSLGVLGEYVGRIFTATRDRPLYVVDAVVDRKTANTANTAPPGGSDVQTPDGV